MSTKKLAKELGVLRQRSRASSGSKRSALSNQIFSYLVVIDFESTCWREKNNYGQEIIEFPAVLLNTSTGEVESEFHTYVQPQERPILSEFCTELTGITQMQVEAGIPLQICLSRFSRWLQSLRHQKGVVFPNGQQRCSDASPSQKLCTFLTWSDWDLGVCLQYECKRKQIHKPDALNNWIDLRSTYRLFYNRKPKGLNGALQDLGIQFEGREHSGLDDSRNTAHLAARMMRDGCIMKITRSLERTPAMSKPVLKIKTCPTESKKDKAHSNVDKTANKTSTSEISPKSCQVKSPSENNTKESEVEESVQSLVSPMTVLKGKAIPSGGSSRRSNTADFITTLSSSVIINTTSLCNNNSLVLCSTVDGLSHVPQPKQSVKTRAEVQLVEEGFDITVETEDRCGSYDDVVLDGDNVFSVTDEDFEYVSDLDSGCYDNSRPLVGQVTLMGKIKETGVGSKCESKEKRQNSTVSEPNTCFAVPKSVTSKSNRPTKGVTQTSSGLQHKSDTKTPSIFKTKALVPGKTSTPNTSFARPKAVVPQHTKHTETPKFTIYTDPANKAAATSSFSTSLFTSKNVLSSLSTNTLPSSSTNRSFVPGTARGGLKITSPLCLCGRRAKRQVVSNGGPNHGRGFYCCPVRRSAGSFGKTQKGCEFFKWESAVMKSSSTAAGSSVSLCHFNSTVNCRPQVSSLRKSY